MVIMQRGADGRYNVTIRRALVESKGWNAGDEMVFYLVGGDVTAVPGDLILRRVWKAEKLKPNERKGNEVDPSQKANLKKP